MLFKVGNMLIEASSESEAQYTYHEVTGHSSETPVKFLGKGYTYITQELLAVDTVESMHENCINCIAERYQDTNGAVKHMMKYITALSEEEIDDIFKALIKTKYDETLPILTLIKSMEQNNISIPRKWHKHIRKHISRFWIKLNYNSDKWYLDENNLELLEYCSDQGIHLFEETDFYLEQLEQAECDAELRRLVNSVNYSYESLYGFVDTNPNYSWIMEHYTFKQKVIRGGAINIINDTHGHGHGNRTVL